MPILHETFRAHFRRVASGVDSPMQSTLNLGTGSNAILTSPRCIQTRHFSNDFPPWGRYHKKQMPTPVSSCAAALNPALSWGRRALCRRLGAGSPPFWPITSRVGPKSPSLSDLSRCPCYNLPSSSPPLPWGVDHEGRSHESRQSPAAFAPAERSGETTRCWRYWPAGASGISRQVTPTSEERSQGPTGALTHVAPAAEGTEGSGDEVKTPQSTEVCPWCGVEAGPPGGPAWDLWPLLPAKGWDRVPRGRHPLRWIAIGLVVVLLCSHGWATFPCLTL